MATYVPLPSGEHKTSSAESSVNGVLNTALQFHLLKVAGKIYMSLVKMTNNYNINNNNIQVCFLQM